MITAQARLRMNRIRTQTLKPRVFPVFPDIPYPGIRDMAIVINLFYYE